VVIARDAIAHIHENLADAALQMMKRNMRAEIVSAGDVLSRRQLDPVHSRPPVTPGNPSRPTSITPP
jgi:hypothetical protein